MPPTTKSVVAAIRLARGAPCFDLDTVAASAAVPLPTLRNGLGDLCQRGRCADTAARAALSGRAHSKRTAGLMHPACPPPVARLAEDDRSKTVVAAAGFGVGPARWQARGAGSAAPACKTRPVRHRRWGQRVAAVGSVSLPQAALRRLLFNPQEKTWVHPSGTDTHLDGFVTGAGGVIAHPRGLWYASAPNPNCPPEVLFALAANSAMFDSPGHCHGRDICEMVASNPSCLAALVTGLAGSTSHETWNSLCERFPSQAPLLVDQAAAHAAPEMRARAALSSLCPTELLDVLACDPEPEVRTRTARSPSISATALQRLAGDDNRLVRTRVAENPRCPSVVLESLAVDPDSDIRRSVVANPSCPPTALKCLTVDADSGIRAAAELVVGLYWPDGLDR